MSRPISPDQAKFNAWYHEFMARLIEHNRTHGEMGRTFAKSDAPHGVMQPCISARPKSWSEEPADPIK